MIPDNLFKELTLNVKEAGTSYMESIRNKSLSDNLREFVAHAMDLINAAICVGETSVKVDAAPVLIKESSIGLPDLGSVFIMRGYDVAYTGDNMIQISWNKGPNLREVKRNEAEI